MCIQHITGLAGFGLNLRYCAGGLRLNYTLKENPICQKNGKKLKKTTRASPEEICSKGRGPQAPPPF
jgi:hypothetical protein